MFRRLLKLTLLLIVVMGASIGGTLLVTNRAGIPEIAARASVPEPPASNQPVVAAPIFAELEPFTVTLYGETRSRILYTAITVRLEDDGSRKQLQEYMPEVRDRVLKVLSAQSLSTVQLADGRQALAQAIKTALRQPFAAPLPGPAIADVLFTAFVVQ